MSRVKAAGGKTLRRIIFTVIAVIIVLSAAVVGMCLFNQRPAVRTAEESGELFPDAVISVAEDGSAEIMPGSAVEARKTGVIFYVGAQITPDAYIPLLARLAEQGYYCSVPKLTFNMAALEPKAAEDVISAHPEIDRWYIAGHSMGGLTASGFAADNPESIDGLILIAAYTNRDMSGLSMPTLSVFGDTDGVMNKKLYDKRLPWYGADFEEYTLAGANHAQYGDYGLQPRDNPAEISPDEQQSKTAELMIGWIEKHEG